VKAAGNLTLTRGKRCMESKNNKRHKVVLTDYAWPDLDIEREILSRISADFVPAHCVSEREVLDLARDADGIIAEYAPITRQVIEKLERCKIISMNAVGYDNVDVSAATDAGILLVNCPDYCYEEVADHTMALLLALARGVFRFDRQIRRMVWDFKSASKLHRIRGTKLGLLGFGRVARSVARKARVFGMEIIASDPYQIDDVFERERVKRVTFENILKESDFLSIHTPFTTETENLVSQKELDTMKNSAFVISTSRGSIIDEKALLTALREGGIKGAALDVMEKEPPNFEGPLFSCENLIITPHAAFYSEEAMAELRTRSSQAVVRVLCERKWPESLVNRELLKSKNTRANLVSGDQNAALRAKQAVGCDLNPENP